MSDLRKQWKALEDANAAVDIAIKEASRQRDKYSAMLAESKGIKVGSRVKVVSENYKGKTTTHVYSVIRFMAYSESDLTLWGRTVRKDGTLGEEHRLWRDWVKVDDQAALVE